MGVTIENYRMRIGLFRNNEVGKNKNKYEGSCRNISRWKSVFNITMKIFLILSVSLSLTSYCQDVKKPIPGVYKNKYFSSQDSPGVWGYINDPSKVLADNKQC